MRKQSGVTLLELIVVIAILGILAAIVVPNFLSWTPRIAITTMSSKSVTPDCLRMVFILPYRFIGPAYLNIYKFYTTLPRIDATTPVLNHKV